MLEELFSQYKCLVTKAGSINASIVSYRLKCPTINLDDSFNWDASDNISTVLKKSSNKLMSVLSNGTRFNPEVVYNNVVLNEFIESNYINLTPDAKLDRVLDYITTLTLYDGQKIKLTIPTLLQVVQMYFYNVAEWTFYLNTAIDQNYVSRRASTDVNGNHATLHSLSVLGITRIIAASEGRNSQYCFVAMAFSDDMFKIYSDAIEPAIRTTGFLPYIVSNEHVDSDKTINDAIIAGIKKSRFTIADFTHHKGGVYFESGFALGRGQKVIYSCHVNDLNNSHFDTRNYQHIVWSDISDFREKLVNKIEAFIK